MRRVELVVVVRRTIGADFKHAFLASVRHFTAVRSFADATTQYRC